MAFVLLALFLYLTLYAWNARTGVLDDIASRSGLEFVGLVIKPGRWTADQATSLWNRYIYLLDVRQDNDALRARLDTMTLKLAEAREQAAEVRRLRRLLSFMPLDGWKPSGARVIAQRLGPNAVLDTLVVDKGSVGGAEVNTPVTTPDGLAGRVLRTGFGSSTVLLVTDQNSKVPVLGRENRTTGILTGQGPDNLLEVRYVPLNAPVDEGEILVTSGLAQIYPKGIPVARVVSIERSDISLFLTVHAEPLVNLRGMEEVLLLHRIPMQPAAPVTEPEAQADAPQPPAQAAPQPGGQ